jgi:hypothetical protein
MLDLNRLARKGFVKFGVNIGARGISWGNFHRGEVASGVTSKGPSLRAAPCQYRCLVLLSHPAESVCRI